jgi:TatD DNase family protein
MLQTAYWDIHTHNDSNDAHINKIVNRHKNFYEETRGLYFSYGLHPWYLTNVPQQLLELTQYAASDHVLAIGECGLDRLCSTDFSLQMEAFRQQIKLANELQKPLIIHCVKAFSETLKLLEDAQVPVIFHGFNKNLQLARQISERSFYCSFGKSILHASSLVAQTFAQYPSNNYFLETDDSNVSIEQLYHKAAALRNTTLGALQTLIQYNFHQVFIKK